MKLAHKKGRIYPKHYGEALTEDEVFRDLGSNRKKEIRRSNQAAGRQKKE
jgi:hypothetical protein